MLKISLILAGIAVALLLVYGADVGASDDEGHGFLPLTEQERGIGFGIPSLLLPIAAFFISMRERSAPLGILIVMAGILILSGGAFVITNAEGEDAISGTLPIVGSGIFVLALGAVKLFQK